jgi:erythromycin esterase-like protein
MRIEITKKLIEEKSFNFVAIEASFPDAYRLNRYVTGLSNDSLESCFNDFSEFPKWMWRNKQMKEFVYWLRDFNNKLLKEERIGIYGIDLYSLHKSMKIVIQYLDKVDIDDANRVRRLYENFLESEGNPQHYGMKSAIGLSPTLEKEVNLALLTMIHNGPKYLKERGKYINGDELMFATKNAELVKAAEEYYRTMYTMDENTWNLRDTFFYKMIIGLLGHYEIHRKINQPKCIVWAHNSHLGDARETSASLRGQLNVGQLLKQHFGKLAFNIGCICYQGKVTAADNWGEDFEFMKLNKGMKGSYEELFHNATQNFSKNFGIVFRNCSDRELIEELNKPRLERYVGVIYRPDTEKQSHYSQSSLPKEFDSVVYFDETNYLVPLDK